MQPAEWAICEAHQEIPSAANDEHKPQAHIVCSNWFCITHSHRLTPGVLLNANSL
jgi:hypothetical protein